MLDGEDEWGEGTVDERPDDVGSDLWRGVRAWVLVKPSLLTVGAVDEGKARGDGDDGELHCDVVKTVWDEGGREE